VTADRNGSVSKWIRWLLCSAVLLGGLNAAKGHQRTADLDSMSTALGGARHLDPPSLAAAEHTAGVETVVTLFVDSQCAASNDTILTRLLPSLHGLLQKQAGGPDSSHIRYVGVALEMSSDRGIRVLRRLGPFDEISVGGGDANQLAVRYLLRDFPGESSIPQVVVLKRTVGRTPWSVHIGEDRLTMRVVGKNALTDWLRSGAPIK
jgi:hypothetical protein